MKFTDVFVKNLKPEAGKKVFKRESNGFTICIYPTGLRSWLYIYTFSGKRKYITLGSYPEMSLSQARQKYNELWPEVKAGRDPADAGARDEDARRLAPTVDMLIDEFIKKHSKPKKKSWERDERLLAKEVSPLWGKRKAADITKRDVITLLEGVVERGAPIQSNRIFEVIRKMFNFAVERDILPSTPCRSAKPLSSKVVRDRNLSEAEIRILWSNLDQAATHDTIKRALKLILVTAQRPGEVAGMTWEEIDGDWWTIPAARSKNGKAHHVFLTPFAKDLIGKEGEGAVFQPRTPGKAMSGGSLAVAVWRNCPSPAKPDIENRLGIEFFRPHDLRRTATTHMARIRVPLEYRERVLNHSKGVLDGTYNLYEYDDEKQEAMERWSAELNRIVTGTASAKVVSLFKEAL